MANSRSELLARALKYCDVRGYRFVEDVAFGFGVHGSVFACSGASPIGYNALKIHERRRPYACERDVYLRLKDMGINEVEGHHVPELVEYDDELMAIEMTVVVRPFVLDFGVRISTIRLTMTDISSSNGNSTSKNSSKKTGRMRPVSSKLSKATASSWLMLILGTLDL
ncbi:MAG: hypothetical protein SFV81_06270 [Pirellulaceae bacterium]|nr:hypothetical protein [Pirellulaceae bacterium]